MFVKELGKKAGVPSVYTLTFYVLGSGITSNAGHVGRQHGRQRRMRWCAQTGAELAHSPQIQIPLGDTNSWYGQDETNDEWLMLNV